MTGLKRKYTVEELYEMRSLILAQLPGLSVNDDHGMICTLVETRLLAYLQNGTTLEELREANRTLDFHHRFRGI